LADATTQLADMAILGRPMSDWARIPTRDDDAFSV